MFFFFFLEENKLFEGLIMLFSQCGTFLSVLTQSDPKSVTEAINKSFFYDDELHT